MLYYFIDSQPILSKEDVELIILESGVEAASEGDLIEFLMYFGVLGVRVDGVDYYIYDTNYDLKPLNIRIQRALGTAMYVVNPAFWPALGIRPPKH